jgi:diguanylate cyclase (GGDEF)-like protein
MGEALRTGTFHIWLALLSFPVAMLALYTSLDMAARIAIARGRAESAWLAVGSLALGGGLWSVHMIGLLAWRPLRPAGYDPLRTALSWVAATVLASVVLFAVSRRQMSGLRLAGLALLTTATLLLVHGLGLSSLRLHPAPHPRTPLLAASILMTLAASGAGLLLGHRLRDRSPATRRLRIRAAAVLGVALAAAQWTAFGAIRLAPGSVSGAPASIAQVLWLACLVLASSLASVAIALVVISFDARLQAHTAALTASLADANEELTYLALHDSLTKLPNRLLLEDRLNQAIQAARRSHGAFSVLFLDLDGFKEVNDVFGHHAGDALLAEVAARVRSAIRSSDTLARLGGDEFVLLADLGDPTSAAGLADKLVRMLAEPFEIDGHTLRISVSIGIALYENSAREAHDILRNADAAMYHAKRLGRSGYCFFEPSMNAQAHEQLQLLQELRAALQFNEIVLHYQPKFHATTSRLAGVEALVRWQHPRRGLLYPDQFVGLAEKSGVILQLGEWVLNEACRQMAEWRARGYPLEAVAVNLSALQFSHAGLVDLVAETLRRYGLAAGCLTLEITETTAMQDPPASMAILRRLSDMGVRISIDDFGTGYSSLLYLKRLPADELKIDRGFVRDLAPDTEDAAIVAAIVALGRTLNLNVVAEGIETRAQQDFLTGLGCSTLQGFLLGRPMPAELLVATLLAGDLSREALSGQPTRRPGPKVIPLRAV